MKVVEAENCVMKSRLDAMEKQMEEREAQSKENIKMIDFSISQILDSSVILYPRVRADSLL